MKQIRKRNGEVVDFNSNKIRTAILKAMEEVEDVDDATALSIAQKIEAETKDITDVECVQDRVEELLMEWGKFQVAKAYIRYRYKHESAREFGASLLNIYQDLTFKDAKDNDVARENANIDGDTSMGTMLKYGSESAKKFNLMYLMKPEHAQAHISGDIHIHDLDFLALTTTCCQIDLNKLFEGGFSTGHGFLRTPNSIGSYASLAAIAIQSNQNDQHGGQSIPAFDTFLAPGVKKTFIKRYYENLEKAITLSGIGDADYFIEKLKKEMPEAPHYDTFPVETSYFDKEAEWLEKEIKVSRQKIKEWQDFADLEAIKETRKDTYQAMEAFIHNLNTMHSRAGAQVPFSSITIGDDTSPEAQLVAEMFLKATDAGLGNGETAIFPVSIFRVKEGVNYNSGDPNYYLFKLAMKVSAKRLFPNFCFADATFNRDYYKEDDYNTKVAYMGCRTRVLANAHDPSKAVTCGRGNLSFTSINLPRLGIEAKGDINKFYEMLDEKMDLVFDQLYDRLLIQGKRKVYNHPFLMGQGVWIDSENLKADDELLEVLKHGTLTTGFIGLAECLKALIGEHHGESERARELGLQIVKHMREKCDKKTAETGLNFTLIATPAEGLSGRFVKIDKEKYGELPGITDRAYYTNSFHIPVYFNITASEKIEIEAPYHELTNGGHISYIEMDGDPLQNLDAFEAIIRYMKENNMGYASINHAVDRDPVCGYTGIIGDVCPRCGRHDGEGITEELLKEIKKYGKPLRCCDENILEEQDKVAHVGV